MQQPAPDPVAEHGRSDGQHQHARYALQRHLAQRMPCRLRPIDRDQDRGQRRNGKQTGPCRQIEHRHVARAAQQQIAEREADRRGHRQRKGQSAEVIAHREADQQQPASGDCDANDLRARRLLAEQQRGKRDGKQRLALHDHRGEARRHPVRHAVGLREKLTKDQETQAGQNVQRQSRPRQKKAGQGCDGEAQQGQKRR